MTSALPPVFYNGRSIAPPCGMGVVHTFSHCTPAGRFIVIDIVHMERHKLSTFRSPVLRHKLVSGDVQQRRKLNLCNAPQLVKVETFALANITSVVVHRVSDGADAFEELSGWETVLVERLVI